MCAYHQYTVYTKEFFFGMGLECLKVTFEFGDVEFTFLLLFDLPKKLSFWTNNFQSRS